MGLCGCCGGSGEEDAGPKAGATSPPVLTKPKAGQSGYAGEGQSLLLRVAHAMHLDDNRGGGGYEATITATAINVIIYVLDHVRTTWGRRRRGQPIVMPCVAVRAIEAASSLCPLTRVPHSYARADPPRALHPAALSEPQQYGLVPVPHLLLLPRQLGPSVWQHVQSPLLRADDRGGQGPRGVLGHLRGLWRRGVHLALHPLREHGE